MHSKGKINEIHYNSLKNEISILYEEIFKKRIESLNNQSDIIHSKGLLNKLRQDIENAFRTKNHRNKIQFVK